MWEEKRKPRISHRNEIRITHGPGAQPAPDAGPLKAQSSPPHALSREAWRGHPGPPPCVCLAHRSSPRTFKSMVSFDLRQPSRLKKARLREAEETPRLQSPA